MNTLQKVCFILSGVANVIVIFCMCKVIQNSKRKD